MTTLQQRLAGLIVLTIVSAVSILAGGVLLGGASADDGSSSSGDILKHAPIDKALFTAKFEGEGAGCVIAFAAAPEGVVSVKPFAEVAGEPIKVEHGRIVGAGGEAQTFTIVNGELVEGELPAGGLPAGAIFTKAAEAKQISAEEIERLKASGELKAFAPEDCTIVNPESMPEGFTPGMKAGIPFNLDVKKAP